MACETGQRMPDTGSCAKSDCGCNPHDHSRGERGEDRRRVAEIVAASALLLLGLAFRQPLRETFASAGEWVVLLAAYLIVGKNVILAAARHVRRGFLFDENFLMSIASLGAIAIRELPEAVSVMLFFSIGELLQGRAVRRSRGSIRALLEVRPDHACALINGVIERMDPHSVPVGTTIIVNPGEKIPLDGRVSEGSSYLDTSALTGESVPRKVQVGDEAHAGMINTEGLLKIEVTRPFQDSSIARILYLVENAAARKAPTEAFITTLSRWYTPAVVLIAAGIALIPPLVVPGAGFSEWIYRALVILVISCPCALVLSIPLGYFGGIGGASRRGILVKGANFLDALTRIDAIGLDKTGTLTRGTFRVVEVVPYEGFSKERILELAAHAESHSSHPIARSIVEAHGKPLDPSRIGRYREIAGSGVRASVDGETVLAGNERLLRGEGIPFGNADARVEGTAVFLALNGRPIGHLLIDDEIKPDAAEAIRALRRQGTGRIVMLTGDDRKAAERVAGRLGISEVHAELLPEQKVELIERLGREGSRPGFRVAFAGDGINDAPVLARADLGIAMGGLGSDAAIETADVVIMDDSPSKIVTAIRIARKTRGIVLQNILFALSVKLGLVILGTLGLASIWEAVFADVGVALIAVVNATRALRA